MPLSEAELDAALASNKTDPTKLSDDEKARLRGDEHADEGGEAALDDENNAGADKGEKGEKGEKRKPNLVPQERVNEIVARSRLRAEGLEARVQELEAELKKGEELDFEEVEKEIDALENQYLKLAKTEGKEEEAAQLRRNIRTMERRVNNMQAVYFARGQSDEAVNRMRTDEVIDNLEATYAFLDPRDRENYDPDIVAEILRYQRGFVASGITPHTAMIDAAQYVLAQLEMTPIDAEAEEDKGEGEGEGLRSSKRELAERQPPQLNNRGKGGAPKSLGAEQLAQAGQQRFNKLRPKMDEDTLAKARGDFV